MDSLEMRVGSALPDWTARHRFDVAAYHRMGEAGIVGPELRIELIDGEIIEMAAIGGPHINTVIRLTTLFVEAAAGRARVSVQNSVRLDNFSEPEPDFALLRPLATEHRNDDVPIASDVLLLVEVAESSLRFDKEVKVPLYARHGIAEVWIVDLAARAVEIYSAPKQGRYTQIRIASAGETIGILAFPDICIAVADILPRT